MKLIWEIENADINKVKAFYEKYKNNSFVKHRIELNIQGNIQPFSRDIFWNEMILCLLTTQQRSGPNSPLVKFYLNGINDISYSKCLENKDVRSLVGDRIRKASLRMYNHIADRVASNLQWLENGGWQEIIDIFTSLPTDSFKVERLAAETIKKNLKGFGPKQSRNLLQSLGYTKFETPIDSRITKWLNNFGFPVKISASALSDVNYYNFLSDGFQALSKASNIYPCLLDAAIFASYDGNWENVFALETTMKDRI
jgi:thermostable 8-oxoguanine DNA glycosylase